MELQTTALTDAQPKMRKSKLARAAKRASARAEAAAKAAGEAAEHADPDSRPEADPVAADEAADTLRGLSLSEASDEPLLKPNPRRFVLFPIQFHDVWQAYKNAEANFWSAEEVEMSDDLDDFESLSRKEQSFILQAVSSLCVGSGVATETILSRFSDEIQIPEARCFFGFELMQKNIHGELCTVVLDMLSPTEQQRDDLVDVILQLPSRAIWTQWCEKHMTKSTAAFSARITALAIFQALHGVSIFHAVAHLAGPETAALSPHSRESHPLQGLVHAVLKIHEDQHQYFKFSALLKSRLNSQADVATIHELVSAAVEAEQALIADMFQLSGGSLALCGRTVSKDTLLRRIEFLADACLADLGIAGIYGVQDPLPWIAALVEREARKSERPVVQAAQSAAAPVQKMDSGEIAFTLDEDF